MHKNYIFFLTSVGREIFSSSSGFFFLFRPVNCRAVERPELKNIMAGTSGAHQGRILANEDIIKKKIKGHF